MLSSSEEEDDQDEEELLQKALAEQAQRDVRYNNNNSRPPARKAPVAPPQKPPPPVAYDDESDAELLSISSDEDGDTRKAAKEADLGIEYFSDEDDFEDEPKIWSKVDEAEISRRVREMREAKSVPGGRLKTAVTMTRKSTMIRDPYPGPREDLIDPLGLGAIDPKTLTLISDTTSPRSTPGRRSSLESPGIPPVRDQLTREKVIYHSENFDPKFYLARVHQKTRASDLEDGGAALKADLASRKQQLKLLVKENFECFVSCKTTIDDIHSKLQQIEDDKEGAGTAHLTSAIENVGEVARRAFGPLLERQAQAEKIRSVQGMLQRFRTLFNLPSAIRANISKGEYDMAVREYKKTKSLVLPSHGTILKRVFEEVEKVVQELKHMLSKCMEDPHAEFSQLENAIRLLLELEPDSDPVWQYLNIQERRIRGLLEGCVIEHEAQMDALHGRTQQKLQSDTRWKQLQSESRRASEVDIFLSADQEHDIAQASMRESVHDESDALMGRLIRRLTTVLIRFVPEFWRLAISIFKGKFAKISSHQGSFKDKTMEPSDDENYPFEEKKDHSPQYTSHSVDEVVAMVQGIVASYDAKVHTAFLPLAETTVMRDYMRDALGEVARACAALKEKDCAPTSAVQAMTSLQMELMHIFVKKFCSLMREKASQLAKEDNWIPVPAVERNGSPFSISAFPLKLRDMLTSSIEHMKVMLDKLQKESSPGSLEPHLVQMQDTLRTAFFKCFLDVTELLDSRAAELAATQEESSETPTIDDKFVGLQMGLEVVNPHQRLLMMLSNVGYMKNVLVRELTKKHNAVWTHESSIKVGGKIATPSEAEVVEALSALEDRILNQYNYAKATSLSTVGAAYIDDDCTQWSSAPPVKGVRDAVVELLHPLVAVHAEIFAGARSYVKKVICFLFEGLMAALLEVSGKTLRHLDVNGYCQLMLELDYVEAVLKLYLTTATRSFLSQLRDLFLQRVLEVSDSEIGGQHGRRSTRGSEDDEQMHLVPEELQARAQQVKIQFLSSELQRTRINVICFLEGADAIPSIEPGKRAGSGLMNSSAGVLQVPSNNVIQQNAGGRHRRRLSGSSFSDEPGGRGLPPLSPYHRR